LLYSGGPGPVHIDVSALSAAGKSVGMVEPFVIDVPQSALDDHHPCTFEAAAGDRCR
jgi:hypothetical protein